MDIGIAGSLLAPSANFVKSPSVQNHESETNERNDQFIRETAASHRPVEIEASGDQACHSTCAALAYPW
jgi:hypothetical protein